MALYRIVSSHVDSKYDARGKQILSLINEQCHLRPRLVRSAVSYLIIGNLTQVEIWQLIKEVFVDPIIEMGYLNTYPNFKFDYALEIGFKPGVTDNVGTSTKEAMRDIFPHLKEISAFSSNLLFIDFDDESLDKANIDWLKKFSNDHLYNSLIERCEIIDEKTWTKKQFSNEPPQTHFNENPKYFYVDLKGKDDKTLQKLSDDKVLSLNVEELKAIRYYYENEQIKSDRQKIGLKDSPTDVEIEVLAQTWSEHCKHKIFAADIEYNDGKENIIHIDSLYKTYIKQATKNCQRDDLLSVFVDNAGMFKFDENNAICLKVETHNSPSALDPYGGAMTGIVGVNRDIIGTGMGAKPIFNTDVFCFGPPDWEINEKINEEQPTDKKPPTQYLVDGKPSFMHPRRIFEGVHRGVKDGGNESGIPTINGAVLFDESFLGKPLVFCGTGGIIPITLNGKPSHEKSANPHDLIVMVGGRIGKDGIHGATFSSTSLKTSSPTSAVQIGDPITQKKMLDFLLEARDLGFYNAITDNGAGGLSSSVGEMAQSPGGCLIHLDRAPLKYPGLDPWEILISEAQERMTLAVSPKHWNSLKELANRRGVEISNLGVFNDSGVFEAQFKGEVVCHLQMDFLHHGLPKLKLKATWSSQPNFFCPIDSIKMPAAQILLKLLSRPNIASKEKWVRQYDHEVGGQSILKPFEGVQNDGPSDAGVIKPVPNNEKGLAIACGVNPFYSKIDTYHMAMNVVDEALRNLISVGVDPTTVVALDNFCWPDPVCSEENPNGEYKLSQLVRANQGLKTICEAYNVPLISGKDSMKNDHGQGKKKISVLPTLLITAAGFLPDCNKAITSHLKKAGNLLVLLGETKRELGESELLRAFNKKDSSLPKVNFKQNIDLYKKIHRAINEELLVSCHDLSEGGLGVTLAEMCIGGRLGANIDLNAINSKLTPLEMLYSESAGRFLVEIEKQSWNELKKILGGQFFYRIGEVTNEKYLITQLGSENYFSVHLNEIVKAWKSL